MAKVRIYPICFNVFLGRKLLRTNQISLAVSDLRFGACEKSGQAKDLRPLNVICWMEVTFCPLSRSATAEIE